MAGGGTSEVVELRAWLRRLEVLLGALIERVNQLEARLPAAEARRQAEPRARRQAGGEGGGTRR